MQIRGKKPNNYCETMYKRYVLILVGGGVGWGND